MRPIFLALDFRVVSMTRPLVCPVLVGRDDLLELARRRIGEVAAGRGHVLFLAGEAGVGKTRLLGSIERTAEAAGFRSVRGGTYPSDLQVAGAAIIDLARAVARSPDPRLAARGAALSALVDDLPVLAATGTDGGRRRRISGDIHRRRRILTLDVAEMVVELASDGPILVELEDLHWSDDLTLQILETVAHRIADVPILVVATYRSDELFPRVPVREWRARLLARRLAEEVRLERLGPADTAIMTTLLLGSDLPAPRDLVLAIQDRSDGIPLHVEELLALRLAAGQDGSGPGHDGALPGTVEDAIVTRIESRSPEAIEIARAGAVIGRSFDLDMLADVTGRTPESLGPGLEELAQQFILLPARVPGRYGFRHALICDVIYEHIVEPERRRLHTRTADAARARPDIGREPFLAIQLERAGRPDEAFPVALRGARSAHARSSHAEALALYGTALRTMPADLPPVERGELHEAYALCAAATDDNTTADGAYVEARAAYLEDGGDPLGAAAVVGPHVAVRHLLGDDLATRATRLQGALDELDALEAQGGAGRDAIDAVRARLLAASAAAHMLDRRLDVSIALAEDARRLASEVDDVATGRHAVTTLGSCFVFAGRMDEGWDLLAAAVADAKTARREADAARAYRMMGSCASVLVEYDRAEHWLREGIDDAERAELWNDRHYMAAHLAHVFWATGRWAAAEELARHALADGRGGITTRITALHTLGFVALGRGQLGAARTHLDEARRLAEGMGEVQRLSPALWGLAEVALADGDPRAALEPSERALEASEAVDDAAYCFPFAVTGTRARLALGDFGGARAWLGRTAERIERRAIPGTTPALDHGRGLLALAEGSTGVARPALIAAAAGWADRRRVWEGAWARIDLARCHLRSNQRAEAAREARLAYGIGTDLGAPAIIAAAAELTGSRRGRGHEGEPWTPLTAREFEVAQDVARGMTNPAIAEHLGISRKTVASHVEHILDKLGMARRAEVAAWVGARPVLHSRPHGDDREE
jgi:DNA-binding CsgD family transcriptional regulator/tetratricopeptide (TPR) repeat protein